MQDLINQLTSPQQRAIEIMRMALNCYNSRDGIGMFTGMGRYSVLADRAKLVATQSRNLPAFWSGLLRKMNWPITPKRADAEILSLLQHPEPAAVLKSLAMEAPFVVMLARYLHDTDKSERKALYEETQALLSADQPDTDTLEAV